MKKGQVRVIFTLLFISCCLSGLNCRGRSSADAAAMVQNEFNSITPPPEALKVEDARIKKANGGLVGAHYSTTRPFAEIRDYYDKQLVANGYRRLGTKSIKTLSGVDYGESTVTYCKGQLMAELYDPGSSLLEHPFQYAFNISVDPFECK